MKTCKMVIGGALIFCVMFPVLVAALENPHEQLTIEGDRPAVFDHDTHLGYGIKCGACHHKSKDNPYSDQEVISQSSAKTLHCAYCHNKEKFADEKLHSLKEIMHKQCKDCHLNGFNGKKGPTRCIGCHKAKK